MSKNEKWISRKEFYDTPKSKKEAYYLEKIGPSGEELVGKFYNKLDKEPEQEEGSMTRAQFEELYSQLSAKTEQRISDMLTIQTKQILEIKSEIRQEFNEFKSEIRQEINEFKSEIRQEFNEFKSEIRQEINEFKTGIKGEINEFKTGVRQEINEFKNEVNQKFDLVFVTMENNQTQTNDRLDRIEEDIKMLKSFHEEDIKKYNEERDKGNKNSKK